MPVHMHLLHKHGSGSFAFMHLDCFLSKHHINTKLHCQHNPEIIEPSAHTAFQTLSQPQVEHCLWHSCADGSLSDGHAALLAEKVMMSASADAAAKQESNAAPNGLDSATSAIKKKTGKPKDQPSKANRAEFMN